MAVRQSPWATFNLGAARPYEYGDVVSQDFYFDVAATAGNGLLAADIVDLGVLPAGAVVVDAILFVEGTAIAATNATVGILTGTPGNLLADDGVSARVLGTEMYNAVALSNSAPVRLPGLPTAIAKSNVDRSIGLQVSANVVAQASKIHVRTWYAAG